MSRPLRHALLRLVPSPRAPAATAPARRPVPTLDDNELMAALRAGDPSAAASLHDRTRPTIDRTLRRLLGAADPDRDDLAQQALIELVTTIDRYRGECSLDAWTSTLTAHLVYKHIRRRQTERRFFVGDHPGAPEVASASSLPRTLDARDALRRLQTHFGTIDEAKLWAFVLHDVHGYDLKEVAQITEVSVSAAQTRLVRGRAEVHAKIEADRELAELFHEGNEGGVS
ncbi:MAG TPA: RNA polymerase sigma factor [Polyangiaceae bacterium]|nr:RNA polymerase sigma factor [Polyangiaceae bacterium]